jgi:hypothetical protein
MLDRDSPSLLKVLPLTTVNLRNFAKFSDGLYLICGLDF